MSYTKCVYCNCKNTSRQVSMFRFPVREPDRLILWIRNSGNLYLGSLTIDELSHRYICAAHFNPKHIHHGNLRSRLLGPAVPEPLQMHSVSAGDSAQQNSTSSLKTQNYNKNKSKTTDLPSTSQNKLKQPEKILGTKITKRKNTKGVDANTKFSKSVSLELETADRIEGLDKKTIKDEMVIKFEGGDSENGIVDSEQDMVVIKEENIEMEEGLVIEAEEGLDIKIEENNPVKVEIDVDIKDEFETHRATFADYGSFPT